MISKPSGPIESSTPSNSPVLRLVIGTIITGDDDVIVLGFGEDSVDPVIELAARDNSMAVVGCGNDFVWSIGV